MLTNRTGTFIALQRFLNRQDQTKNGANTPWLFCGSAWQIETEDLFVSIDLPSPMLLEDLNLFFYLVIHKNFCLLIPERNSLVSAILTLKLNRMLRLDFQ